MAVIIHYEKLKVLLLAFYITVVVFAIAFIFQYVLQTYHIALPDSNYIWSLAFAVSAIAIGYAVISIMTALIDRFASRRFDKTGVHIVKFVAQVIGYSILLLIILDIFNISPTTLIVEGAVGGVILGLALQTLTPIIFSGVLIQSSRTLVTGDVVIMESSYWGGAANPKFCKIKKVGVVFTQLHDSSGHLLTIPNTLLMNYAISTRLENKGVYKYSVLVNIKNDVSAEVMGKYIDKCLKSSFAGVDLQTPRALFINTTDNTLIYAVVYYFNDIYEVDETINKIQSAMDKAYWLARGDPKMRKQAKV